MHYLIALAALFLLWRSTRALVRRFRPISPVPRIPPTDINPDHPLPSMTIATQPKHRWGPYFIGGLMIIGAGWFFRDALFPPRPRTHSVEQNKNSTAPESLTPTAPQNAPPSYFTQDGCEWVKPFTHGDGSFVEGHWISKPGHICPLIATPMPATQQHQSAPIHVGPRGGEYHYSKSGKKVYEHRR